MAEEDVIEMPREGVMQSCGFAIDIGGSVAKIVYRAKCDRDYNRDTNNVWVLNFSDKDSILHN